MNDEVRLPIITNRNGNKITKECAEDVYKIVNRVYAAMDKAYNKSVDVLEALPTYNGDPDTCIIIGRGTSQPCLTDAFDEEIGNNIAFMKMKLNANLKKFNFLVKVFDNFLDCTDTIYEDIERIQNVIMMDLEGIRKHNPDYLEGIEKKIGIIDEDEVQEA